VLLILVGLFVVLSSVVSGYLLERGSLLVLMQPAELLIIVGGALGIILISGPRRNLRVLSKTVFLSRSRSLSVPDTYLEALRFSTFCSTSAEAVEVWRWNRTSKRPTKVRYSWRIRACCTTPRLPPSFATRFEWRSRPP
jgi:hypothetical protein